MQTHLILVESDDYYFDAEAAERPIRFIETFCRHYEGACAGEPFLLLEWQKLHIRNLYGWLHRHGPRKGLRRFKELYIITAKGAGKTPKLSGLGLYHLLGEHEPGAHVISMASTFEQANLTFDAGKKYITESLELSRHKGIAIKQFAITGPLHSKWTTISGKPKGRSGPRPSCLIADECHEWTGETAKAYELMTANLFKRREPMLLVATNAGENRSCFAWQVHERAQAILSGELKDDTLYPVIYEAPAHLDWRSEDAAKAANPSLGSFITFDQLKPELAKGEARYRRLYLSQWIRSESSHLIDMDLYGAAAGTFTADTVKGYPLYVGIDLSQDDDLSAVTRCYASEEQFYVNSQFWVPRATADKYERRDGITYTKWAGDGHITLLDEPTISPSVKRTIAAQLIELHKTHPIKAVCYDRYKADDCVAALEAAGIVCIPIAQGYTVSPGCAELTRRLKDKSITIANNPVLRFCAENAETKHDDRGNTWVAKPSAHGRYAGTRSKKVDGISALVTALVEARKTTFATTKSTAKAWII